jgi:hypothetical protein
VQPDRYGRLPPHIGHHLCVADEAMSKGFNNERMQ